MQNDCAEQVLIRICIENVICKNSRPSKFHFLEHWRLQASTHWAIFLALIALKLFVRRFSALVAHPNFEKSSAKRVVFAQGAVLQNDIIYHTCNFVTFWWLVLFAVCFWWLYTHFWLRLGPFEMIFASVWVRFRLVFRPHGLCKCKCKCTCKCTCNRKCNCYLIRATGGLSIDR